MKITSQTVTLTIPISISNIFYIGITAYTPSGTSNGWCAHDITKYNKTCITCYFSDYLGWVLIIGN